MGTTRERTRALHRNLILRLIGITVLVSGVLGIGTYLAQRERLAQAIETRAQLGVALLRAELRSTLREPGALPSPEALHQALLNAARDLPDDRPDRFVYIRIHDAQGSELIAHNTSADAADLDALSAARLRFPEKHIALEALRGPRGERLVAVAIPVFNARGERRATINGLYALSAQTLAALHRELLMTVLAVIGVVLVTAALLYPAILGLMRRLAAQSLQLLDANLQTLRALGDAIAKRDSDTDAHNYRVTLYAVRLAEHLGMESRAIGSLIKGAFLHDVGKIGIRDAILLKPGRLDEAEFAVMREHVAHGLQIVGRADWLNDAADVVGCHHEKFDGSGYLKGLSGEGIPFAARIFAIADVFDALTSERPYKKAFELDKALRIIREGSGGHFDPALVEAFASLAPELYAEYARRDDDDLRAALDSLVQHYFKALPAA